MPNGTPFRVFTGIIALDSQSRCRNKLSEYMGGYSRGIKLEESILPGIVILEVETNFVDDVKKKLKEIDAEILAVIAFGAYTIEKVVEATEYKAEVKR